MASEKARMFEQAAAEQAKVAEKPTPSSVTSKGGKVAWSDPKPQVCVTASFS